MYVFKIKLFFTKYVKIAGYDFHVLNAVALPVFTSETAKLCNNFRPQMTILTVFRFFAFFF